MLEKRIVWCSAATRPPHTRGRVRVLGHWSQVTKPLDPVQTEGTAVFVLWVTETCRAVGVSQKRRNEGLES